MNERKEIMEMICQMNDEQFQWFTSQVQSVLNDESP